MKADKNTSLLQFHYAFTFSELPAVAFTFLNCPSVAMALRICPSFCSFVNMTQIPLSWVIIFSSSESWGAQSLSWAWGCIRRVARGVTNQRGIIRACQRKRPQLLLLKKPTFHNKRLLKNHMYVGTNVLWITAFLLAHQWKTVCFGDAEMKISVAGCSWGVCFAAIAFSIVPAFCANGIQLTLLSATSKVALHWPGMIVEFRIYQSLPKKKTTLIAVAEANFS